MVEEWKPVILDKEAHVLVSNKGRVMLPNTGAQLPELTNGKVGYWTNHGWRTVPVWVLVADAFVGVHEGEKK